MKRLRRPAFAVGLTLTVAAMTAASAQAPQPAAQKPTWAAEDPIANEGVIEDGAIAAI